MDEKIGRILTQIRGNVTGKDPAGILGEVVRSLGAPAVGLASSLGAEDQVLTHILRTQFPEVGIFTIDTGRLPQETYDVMQETMEKYAFRYDILVPDAGELAQLVGEYGPNLFYQSVELRKKCCAVRKVAPLRKKLAALKAWVTGLRREQAVTRSGVEAVEWDDANALVKVNPLVDWTEAMVREYIQKHKVPYNKLHDKKYPSIGCAPCTRAVEPGEDIRAGRWWWEQAEHKECGLHRRKE